MRGVAMRIAVVVVEQTPYLNPTSRRISLHCLIYYFHQFLLDSLRGLESV
jgi:hypothetical protein